MSKIAALYTSGKLVTGNCHGEAYSKLNEIEKDQEIHSGFIDQKNLKFISDSCEFYLKKIILMRHADSEGKKESGVTEKGRNQIKQISTFFREIKLIGYKCFCSSFTRCIDTASLLGFNFAIDKNLNKCDENEAFETFVSRVGQTLDNLPEKSLLISHCDFIKVMTELAVGDNVMPDVIPNCSITAIITKELFFIPIINETTVEMKNQIGKNLL